MVDSSILTKEIIWQPERWQEDRISQELEKWQAELFLKKRKQTEAEKREQFCPSHGKISSKNWSEKAQPVFPC